MHTPLISRLLDGEGETGSEADRHTDVEVGAEAETEVEAGRYTEKESSEQT